MSTATTLNSTTYIHFNRLSLYFLSFVLGSGDQLTMMLPGIPALSGAQPARAGDLRSTVEIFYGQNRYAQDPGKVKLVPRREGARVEKERWC